MDACRLSRFRIFAVCAALFAVAACSGAAEEDEAQVASVDDLVTTSAPPTTEGAVADSSESETTTTAAETVEEQVDEVEDDGEVSPLEEQELALLDFSACMRDEGLDEFPDLSVDASGSIDTGAVINSGVAVGTPEFNDAVEVCTELVDDVTFAPNATPDVADIVDQLFMFTSCLRDEGVDAGDLQLATLLPKAQSIPEGATRNEALAYILDLDLDDPGINDGIDACAFHLAGLPGAEG